MRKETAKEKELRLKLRLAIISLQKIGDPRGDEWDLSSMRYRAAFDLYVLQASKRDIANVFEFICENPWGGLSLQVFGQWQCVRHQYQGIDISFDYDATTRRLIISPSLNSNWDCEQQAWSLAIYNLATMELEYNTLWVNDVVLTELILEQWLMINEPGEYSELREAITIQDTRRAERLAKETSQDSTVVQPKASPIILTMLMLEASTIAQNNVNVLASIADNLGWHKELLADGQVLVTSIVTVDNSEVESEPMLPGASILARRQAKKDALATKVHKPSTMVLMTMLLDTPIVNPKPKVEKLFSFSQTSIERARLEALFTSLVDPKLVSNLDSVVEVKEEQLDTARAELDLATKASDSLGKKILHREYCDLRQRSTWKKELAVLEASRLKAESAFDSASRDYSDAKDLARDERDYASFVLLPFIITVAKFAHSGNDRASKQFWKDKAHLAGIPLSENDWYALKKWAWEKAKAYCYGYILRQHTSGDNLLAYQESLPDLALNMLEELGKVDPKAKVEAIKYSSDSRLGAVKPWGTYSAYVKTLSYRPNVERLADQYPNLTKPIIDSVVNESEIGHYSWSHWHRCLIATNSGLPLVYLPVASLLVELHAQLADMDSKNKAFAAKQAELDAAKELAKQQALLAEIKRGYSETIPINRVWDKTANIYQDSNYISNGQIFFNSNFFRTLENARLFFPNDGKNPYSKVVKNPTTFTSYAQKLASLPYQIASVVGTKAVTFKDSPNILALTYFATSSNKVLAVNTGYLQLLGRLGILAQVAHYCICDSGELILRSHNGDILAAIMQVRLTPTSKDYLDLNLLASNASNNQATSVAA